VDETSKNEIDRLALLAHAGAVQAAEALAQLVGDAVTAEPPIVHSSGAADSDPQADPHAERASTGVFFEFEGCLEAIVGILFPGESSDRLVRRIVGIEHGELEAPIVESALMEVGNILASHVASAIADQLASRLLPSIPSLAMDEAEDAFEAFAESLVGADAARIESRLRGPDGRLIGRLLLSPRP
jgi:chemotaxis protein CheY-P-specific phosphatase CheC